MRGILTDAARSLAKGFLQLVYPAACWGCGQLLTSDPAPTFCPSCRDCLTGDTAATCPRCASTVGPFVNLDGGCLKCRGLSLAFDRAVRLGPYEGLLRDIILRMKQPPGEGLAEVMGRLWAAEARGRLAEFGAEVVIPVPLHWTRRWQRGFNQSEVLARALAAQLKLPCRPRWLRRSRHTAKQTAQPPSGRGANVRGAFQARAVSGLRHKAVLVVDDVLTTGSTASEAARALRAAGAGRVAVAVLAHDHR